MARFHRDNTPGYDDNAIGFLNEMVVVACFNARVDPSADDKDRLDPIAERVKANFDEHFKERFRKAAHRNGGTADSEKA